jgi:hypothetical protein
LHFLFATFLDVFSLRLAAAMCVLFSNFLSFCWLCFASQIPCSIHRLLHRLYVCFFFLGFGIYCYCSFARWPCNYRTGITLDDYVVRSTGTDRSLVVCEPNWF